MGLGALDTDSFLTVGTQRHMKRGSPVLGQVLQVLLISVPLDDDASRASISEGLESIWRDWDELFVHVGPRLRLPDTVPPSNSQFPLPPPPRSPVRPRLHGGIYTPTLLQCAHEGSSIFLFMIST